MKKNLKDKKSLNIAMLKKSDVADLQSNEYLYFCYSVWCELHSENDTRKKTVQIVYIEV